MTIGITVGKFWPLHKGHEFMIRFAADVLSELIVVVSDRETENISERFDAVDSFCRSLPNVTVRFVQDNAPTPKNVDANGTVLDREFQNYWADVLYDLCPQATHFVSSDMYGGLVANNLGIKWLPVDPKREFINISGAQIRMNDKVNYHLISDHAKEMHHKRIAIVGAESTGKTSLCKLMTSTFEGGYVAEYGRTLSEIQKNELTSDDFKTIALGQHSMILQAALYNYCSFVDTEAYTTYLLEDVYLKNKTHMIKELGSIQKFDAYIVMAPTVEWVDDGTRVMNVQEDRDLLHEKIIEILTDANKTFIVVDKPDFKSREEIVYNFVKGLLG